MKEVNLLETKQSFGLRKLSVGLASVLIGISFLSGTKTNVVKVDTKESPKENVQDAQDKNNEDLQSAILKNTSSQNAIQTDYTNVDSSTGAVRDTSANQVGQVAGAERDDSSARATRTSQLEQVNSIQIKPSLQY